MSQADKSPKGSEQKTGFLSAVSRTFEGAQDSAQKLVGVADTMRTTSENFRIASENGKVASENINSATLTASKTIKQGLTNLSFSVVGSTMIWAAVTIMKIRK